MKIVIFGDSGNVKGPLNTLFLTLGPLNFSHELGESPTSWLGNLFESSKYRKTNMSNETCTPNPVVCVGGGVGVGGWGARRSNTLHEYFELLASAVKNIRVLFAKTPPT